MSETLFTEIVSQFDFLDRGEWAGLHQLGSPSTRSYYNSVIPAFAEK